VSADEIAPAAAPVAVPADQGGVTPDAPDEPTTLAEHDAKYGDAARAAAEAAPADAGPDTDSADAARDAKGRFQPRHRAASQAATPDDVPTIAALTKRIKDAEAASGADIVAQPGESPRVFELRRRAELAERRAAAPTSAAPRPAPIALPVMPAAPAAAPAKPTPESFPYGTSDPAYLEALADWKIDATLAARDRARAEHDAAQQRAAEGARIAADWQTRVAAAKTTYPDFDRVALHPDAIIPPILARGTLGEAFVYEDPTGPDVLYYLLTHADEAEQLRQYVANPMALFRALTLLGQRLTTSTAPAQAASTGSAARLGPPAAPRPPNPVRTGPLTTGDAPPDDDDQSLANHERYFGRRR
jgi:hypothetical protein